MRNFTKGVLIGSVAIGSVMSASMVMQNSNAKRNILKGSKKAYRAAEDLLNM